MARLGNQEVVEYYRNDSPAMVVRMEKDFKKCAALEEAAVGVHILKYCRREEERRKGKKCRGSGGLL